MHLTVIDQAVPGRSCRDIGCTLCCKLPGFKSDEIGDKPPATWCKHCDPSEGCTIYDDRPEDPCRTFVCAWLGIDYWPVEVDPVKTRCMVVGEIVESNTGPTQIVRVHENAPRAADNIEGALRALFHAGAGIYIYNPSGDEVRAVGWHPATDKQVTFFRAHGARSATLDVPTITLTQWEKFRFSAKAIQRKAEEWLAQHKTD